MNVSKNELVKIISILIALPFLLSIVANYIVEVEGDVQTYQERTKMLQEYEEFVGMMEFYAEINGDDNIKSLIEEGSTLNAYRQVISYSSKGKRSSKFMRQYVKMRHSQLSQEIDALNRYRSNNYLTINNLQEFLLRGDIYNGE